MLVYVCYNCISVLRSGGTGGSAASSPALLRDSPQYKPAGNASLLLAASTTPPSVSEWIIAVLSTHMFIRIGQFML